MKEDIFAHLKENIDTEIKMARQISESLERISFSPIDEQKIYAGVADSLQKKIKVLNSSVPEILREISLVKKLGKRQSSLEKLGFSNGGILIKRRDKDYFLEQLNISKTLIKRLKKKDLLHKEKKQEMRTISPYGKLANRFFLRTSEDWIGKGNFKSLSLDLRRSNLNILTVTYVSIIFLSIFIASIAGILLTMFLLVFNVSYSFPFVSFQEGNYFLRFLKIFWIIIAIPFFTWVAIYYYPNAEKKSLEKKINRELPFMVVHMASISGSGVEPGQIFRIIALSKEYKYTGKEINKILNQTNLYGYDLTNALRNVARATPSTKLAELLNGISITINSGGDIKTFFEKRAESLLLEYRLEREKFIKVAETFMDIYISIVIATPMILLLLLIMIAVSGIGIGLGISELTIAIIGVVAIINILFLAFLHLKQPAY